MVLDVPILKHFRVFSFVPSLTFKINLGLTGQNSPHGPGDRVQTGYFAAVYEFLTCDIKKRRSRSSKPNQHFLLRI